MEANETWSDDDKKVVPLRVDLLCTLPQCHTTLAVSSPLRTEERTFKHTFKTCDHKHRHCARVEKALQSIRHIAAVGVEH